MKKGALLPVAALLFLLFASCAPQTSGPTQPPSPGQVQSAEPRSTHTPAPTPSPDPVTDPHPAALETLDMTELEALYASRHPASGDMHNHTWYSDAYNTMKEMQDEYRRLGYDFSANSDHNNYRQVFDPLWSEDRNLVSLEYTTSYGHMNVYFREKEPLEKAGQFTFTREGSLEPTVFSFDKAPAQPSLEERYWGQEDLMRYTRNLRMGTAFYDEFVNYIHGLGGLVMLNHPCFNDFLFSRTVNGADPYFGADLIEIWYGVYGFTSEKEGKYNFEAYLLWQRLLNAGHKIYAVGSSDAHSLPNGKSVSTLWVENNNYQDYFDAIKAGNFSISDLGGPTVRMCIGDVMMGGTATYADGKTLKAEVDLRGAAEACVIAVHTDKGVCFYRQFSGGLISFELPIEDRMYYRLEVLSTDEAHTPLAFSNPIFLD